MSEALNMKEGDFVQAFSKAHPKAVDFPRDQFDRLSSAVLRLAGEAGYRMAGFRSGRVVFTTKPPKDMSDLAEPVVPAVAEENHTLTLPQKPKEKTT